MFVSTPTCFLFRLFTVKGKHKLHILVAFFIYYFFFFAENFFFLYKLCWYCIIISSKKIVSILYNSLNFFAASIIQGLGA